MFIRLPVPLMAILAVYLLTVRYTLNTNILIFLCQMLIYCVLVSILIAEKTEEKNNGYAFMSHLPIKDHDIVASKFVVVIGVVALLYLYSVTLISFMEVEADILHFVRVLLLLCGNLSLILAAGMYILVYRWGYSSFMKISVITVIVLMVGPFLFIEFVLVRRNIDYEGLFQSVNNLSWIIWLIATVISLMLFWGLLQTAIKAKENQRGK